MKMRTTEVEQSEMTMVAPERPIDEFVMLDLLLVLAEHKNIMFGVTLAATLIAASVSLLIPNRYTAVTRILPPQQAQSSSSLLMSQLASSGLGPLAGIAGKDFGLKNPNDLYIGILKSRTIEDALIARFDLLAVYERKRKSDTRRDLENASSIVSKKEGLIEIAVEDKSPKRAADIANQYVLELRKALQSLAVTEAAQRRLFFEQQLEQAKTNLAEAELALKQTQQKTGLVQIDGQAKAIIEAVVNMRAQIAAKEVELRALRSFATEKNSDVIIAEQQLAGLRAQLVSLIRQGGGDGDLQLATSKVPEAGLEFVRKARNVKYHELIFEMLSKQYEAAKLDEAKSAAIIQVLDPAVEPDQKSSPPRAKAVMLIAVAAFLCTWLMLCFKEHATGHGTHQQRAKLDVILAALRRR